MAKYILKKTIDNKNLSPIDFQSELNSEQLKVVLEGDGPCLVLAGAGSGKTRTLVYRVSYLLKKGIDPKNILLVTFTNKAAKEMLERIESLLGCEASGIWGGTFHHIGNRLLRMYGKSIGINQNFTILDSEDSLTLIKNSLCLAHPPEDKYFPKAKVIAGIISLSANLSRSIKEVLEDRYGHLKEEYYPIIINTAEIYKQRKEVSNSLDFDDLLLNWNKLLTNSPEVRERLCRQFKYILVDEYQDINQLQNQIIVNIAEPQNNVLVVGDDAQSIYGFRGADVNNILQFPNIFPEAKVFRLEVNYRSTPEILELANYSINQNNNKFEKHLSAVNESRQKPSLSALTDLYQQADFICQKILDLQRDEDYSLNDIAVLFRSHFQSLELEMELNKRNIPYQMRGGLRFFEQAHVKDTLAHLRILVNLKDQVSWLRILSMQPGIGDATSERIWNYISEFSSLEEIINSDLKLGSKALSGWQGLKRILAQLKNIDVDDIPTLIQTVLDYGYENYLKANFENYNDRLEDLEQLVNFTASYDSTEKFLSETALTEKFKGGSKEDYQDGAEEAVILSTIHQAKGLEWKAVFVVGLCDGQFPHAKVYDKPQEMEEERRLFYVAVTRAKEQLYLTYPLFGVGDSIAQPSQFIKELKSNLYEKLDIEEDDGEDVIYVDEEGERAPSKRKYLDFEI